MTSASVPAAEPPILTPDQRLRVFVSSTLQELAEERQAAKAAIEGLRLTPVMFELGARAHPPRALYRAYLEQSQIFVGIYWQRYGWVAPGEEISGLEDEYRLSGERPKLIYVKTPAPEREERLKGLLGQVQRDDQVSYKPFTSAQELQELLRDDLALLLTEHFTAVARAARREPQAPEVAPLPATATPIVGREAELAELREVLVDPETRLLTLSGPGGIGKTRLALELARQAAPAFEDGVAFVPLATVLEPELVVSSMAQALRLSEAGQPPLINVLKRHLAHKRLLLMLDNFEQVVAAAAELAELLASCPRLTLLVTSRERLNVAAERAYPVPPLALPAGGEGQGRIGEAEAVRLFVARARALKPEFALSSENAPAVAEICRRLDGLPLAIELAAARIKLFTPAQLLARLEKPLELLGGGARDLPERQRTIRATVAWSYDLLTADEQKLFRRLGVFVGARTFEAIEAVCGAPGDLDVLATLESLIDKSLLRLEEAGEASFALLQTVAEFARERLEALGERAAAAREHARYYLALAERAEPELRGAEQRRWLERLELEHGNLRAALAWAEAEGDDRAFLRLAWALWRFWYARGYLTEGRGWLTKAAAKALGNATAEGARALHGAAVLAYTQGARQEARRLAEASLETSRELNERETLAFALNHLGVMACDAGDYDEAEARHREALAIRRELGDPSAVAHSLLNLGNVFSDRGDYAGARALYQESLATSRAKGDTSGVVNALLNLGNLAYDGGEHALSWQHHEEALRLSRELGDKSSVAHALGNLANVRLDQGDHAAAHALYLESLAIRREMGDRQGSSHALLNLGILAFDQGEYAEAARLYRESLQVVLELGDKWRQLYLLEAFAGLAVAAGDAERAARLLGAAFALREQVGAPMPPPERPRYERSLAGARSALPPERFEALWREGGGLSLEAAIRYAAETPARA